MAPCRHYSLTADTGYAISPESPLTLAIVGDFVTTLRLIFVMLHLLNSHRFKFNTILLYIYKILLYIFINIIKNINIVQASTIQFFFFFADGHLVILRVMVLYTMTHLVILLEAVASAMRSVTSAPLMPTAWTAPSRPGDEPPNDGLTETPELKTDTMQHAV